MVIDLPFEGRKVKGSRKYRGRERVPKVGSRREETITEPINSRIGEFLSAQTASFPSSSSGNIQAVSSCVETLQRLARSQGFSSLVARQIAFARRPSSRAGYQAKWSVFRRWCHLDRSHLFLILSLGGGAPILLFSGSYAAFSPRVIAPVPYLLEIYF